MSTGARSPIFSPQMIPEKTPTGNLEGRGTWRRRGKGEMEAEAGRKWR